MSIDEKKEISIILKERKKRAIDISKKIETINKEIIKQKKILSSSNENDNVDLKEALGENMEDIKKLQVEFKNLVGKSYYNMIAPLTPDNFSKKNKTLREFSKGNANSKEKRKRYETVKKIKDNYKELKSKKEESETGEPANQ